MTIAVLCLVVSLMVTWLAAAAITKPLKKLSRSMRRLQTGDFTQRVFLKEMTRSAYSGMVII